ncbi:hypothetical protein H7J07_04835 [Mycobacterium koreense]|uniref:Uncharacterized protein n=1 Tax=Mycolicibacillus koreensis TaxID=1069220 RepID=A0A7I7SC39_9MYCO|nr:hypothetical protein [Mycolicibacillus koreensis]MCV7247583.1 hypothetical protein [Mycolicibacillus koreensis]OSC32838.1 hypothetical protein B8W67_14060 [Mycolicibacillus koreensis]BBY53961.1 hypothetical protein MKOR_12120 [Mycolicibacillus koreensis]
MTDAAEHRRDRAREAAAGLEYLAGLARGNDYADEYHLGGSETAMLLGDAFEKFAEALESKVHGDE